jgi:acyl dehydratase
MLVASFALGMLPFDPERVIALRRVRDAVFKRPVCLGDTVHVAGRVDRLDSVNAMSGIVGVRADVLNQRSALVVRMGVEVLWRRGDDSLATVEEPFELAGLPI